MQQVIIDVSQLKCSQSLIIRSILQWLSLLQAPVLAHTSEPASSAPAVHALLKTVRLYGACMTDSVPKGLKLPLRATHSCLVLRACMPVCLQGCFNDLSDRVMRQGDIYGGAIIKTVTNIESMRNGHLSLESHWSGAVEFSVFSRQRQRVKRRQRVSTNSPTACCRSSLQKNTTTMKEAIRSSLREKSPVNKQSNTKIKAHSRL